MEGLPPFIPGRISSGASSEPNELPRISKDKRLRKPTSRFFHNLMNYFPFFKFKKRKAQEPGPKSSITEHKLRTPTVSTLSLSRMEPKIDALPYKWPADGTVDPKNTALVIIDMQIDCMRFSFLFQFWFMLYCTSFFLSVSFHPTFVI